MMDAFESLISMLLRHEGYWTHPRYKVELTKEQKRAVSLPSAPRWELDLIAFKGATNELLVVECKSFLDSTGVVFRNGQFEPPKRYKLFTNELLRETVLGRLAEQLAQKEACPANVKPILCMAAGHIARKSDLGGMRSHFDGNGWRLFDVDWIRKRLNDAVGESYENDLAFVIPKLLSEDRSRARRERRRRSRESEN
jgi:hypothetical protein